MTGRYDAPQHIEVHQGLAGAGDALDQHGCLGRRGEDSRYHATLVGRQLRGRGRREPGERIAWASHVGVACEPLPHQAVEHRRGEAQSLHHVAQRRRAPQRLERLVCQPALGRPLEHALPLEQRRHGRHQHHHTVGALGRPGRALYAPEGARKQGAQRPARRRPVVAADPASQLEHRPGERRFLVRSGHDGLRGHRRSGHVDRGDHTHHPASLHRDDHARPGHHAAGELRGNLVGVGAGDGEREDDLRECH